MEVRAVAKYVRVQPRKVRIVAREIKGQPAIFSAQKLSFHPSKGAFVLRKVLVSAIANAVENNGVAADTLRISSISVDEGPRLKRIRARAQGRANRIVKKTSHITVVLEEVAGLSDEKKHEGTKPKPRPKFAAPKKPKPAVKAEAKAEDAEVKEEVAAEETVVETAVEEVAAVDEAPSAEVAGEEEKN